MTTPAGRTVTMVAAVAENGVIGGEGDMLWHIPEDFAHFKATTIGHTLIMGRTTHEGIGKPLPGRTTIVLTRDPSWSDDGVLVAHSIEEALALADTLPGAVMIGGGAAVYEAAMPYADVQVLSEIPLAPEGDAHYPAYDREEWAEERRELRDGFTIVWWRRATD
jgi:dihydrofolate reductase